MISLEEASDLINRQAQLRDRVKVNIEISGGFSCATDIIAPIDVSPFRNSAMDGFAVSTSHIDSFPVTLPVRAVAFAGVSEEMGEDNKKALKIMTGAVMPEQYDAVVKVEDTVFDDHEVTISAPVKPGQHVRPAGEDMKKGDAVLKSGEMIRPHYIGLLAGMGLKKVSVVSKPRVLILSTGDELVSPGVDLRRGQIYDSNSYTMESMLRPFCATLDKRRALGDNFDQLVEALSADYDVIVSSGGVSAGDKDYLPSAAESCGWRTVFHKAKVKPGKPIYFATRESRLYFGLPGNPLSTLVTCAVFVIPALKKMIGFPEFELKLSEAELADGEPAAGKRTLIWPGTIWHEKGRYLARLSEKRSSASLSAVLGSDGLIFIDCDGNGNSEHKIKICFWSDIFGI